MPNNSKRPGKPLLIATVGLATLCYGGLSGCDDEPESSGNLLPPPADGGLDSSADTGTRLVPDSGNLLPPPPEDAMVSGNLLPPPPQDAATDAASDASRGLDASGNLMPPPGDAGETP